VIWSEDRADAELARGEHDVAAAAHAERRRELLRAILESNASTCSFIRHRAEDVGVYRRMRMMRITRVPDDFSRARVVGFGREMVAELAAAGVPEARLDLVRCLWAFIHGIDIK
jgi:hypothetical protein